MWVGTHTGKPGILMVRRSHRAPHFSIQTLGVHPDPLGSGVLSSAAPWCLEGCPHGTETPGILAEFRANMNSQPYRSELSACCGLSRGTIPGHTPTHSTPAAPPLTGGEKLDKSPWIPPLSIAALTTCIMELSTPAGVIPARAFPNPKVW